MNTGDVKEMEIWEVKILVNIPTYKLQIVMDY